MSEATGHDGQEPITNALPSENCEVHFKFSAPSSYFIPSLPETEPPLFDPSTTNFGLISQSYDSDSSLPNVQELTDWERFTHHVASLNSQASDHTSYHVLYLARHGQGYHNLAETYYGTQNWDCYYSLLDGDLDKDSGIIWADAQLSKLGRSQAHNMSKLWESQITTAKMPIPELWFSSPMERACRTAEITFQSLQQNGILKDAKFIPTVKELLRETNGIHTCDRRSKRSVIAEKYPWWHIEEGFTEEDELWNPVYRETNEAHTYRVALLLDDILGSLPSKDVGKFISLTAHGGAINAVLRAIRHREFQVNVGSAIAVLVKAERQNGRRPLQHFGKGEKAPTCVGDPLKAGLPGFKNLKDYVDYVENKVS